MKIGNKLNTHTYSELTYILRNHKKYSDFNVLGLYRAICESEKLELNQKIELRDLANEQFKKTFEFFQLKDPYTYFLLTTLGLELTEADEGKIWSDIKLNQQKILKDKRIKHRNFGIYSKHTCGYANCPYNGMMITQGSMLADSDMHFKTDKSSRDKVNKSGRNKKERKAVKRIIDKELE